MVTIINYKPLAAVVAGLFALPAVIAADEPWSVTEYLVSTKLAGDTFSSLYSLKPGVTPKGVSTVDVSTYTNRYYTIAIDVVEITVLGDEIKQTDIATTSTEFYDDIYTTYWAAVEIAAPTSCSEQFTLTTSVPVSIPPAFSDKVKPTSTDTETFYFMTGTYVNLYLETGAVPLQPEVLEIEGYQSDVCDVPYSSLDDDDDSTWRDTRVCYVLTGCTSLGTYVIVLASVIPGLFVLGLAESFFWFRRLMLGRSAMRLGTLCWILMCFWVVCFTRHSLPRPAEDHERLRQQWKDMSLGRKLKLWLRWGFRWSYPEKLLGTDPRVLKAVEDQAAAQAILAHQGGPVQGQKDAGPITGQDVHNRV